MGRRKIRVSTSNSNVVFLLVARPPHAFSLSSALSTLYSSRSFAPTTNLLEKMFASVFVALAALASSANAVLYVRSVPFLRQAYLLKSRASDLLNLIGDRARCFH